VYVFALQAALGISGRERTGFFGAHTRVAVLAFKASHHLGRTARVSALVWRRLPVA
jgi:peptidoglycan hydrolase-like protein with peptidoglycan-binding domain